MNQQKYPLNHAFWLQTIICQFHRTLIVLLLTIGLTILAVTSQAGVLANRNSLYGILGSNPVCDDFERFNWAGNYFVLGTNSLDSNWTEGTQTNLVQPNVIYKSIIGNVAWLAPGHFDGPTKRIWANGSTGLRIDYTKPVRAFGFDLYIKQGVGANVTVNIHTVSNGVISVPYAFNSTQTPKFVGYNDLSGITRVDIIDNNGNAALSLDDHCFGCPKNLFWCENFSAYAYGAFPVGANNKWHTWSGGTADLGSITDLYCSAPKGLHVTSDTDVVREFTCIDSGKWIFKWDWLIRPSTGANRTWVILMSEWPGTGPERWCVQIGANATNVAYQPVVGSLQLPFATLPTKLGQWAEVCVEIDLDNDLVNVYYDGQPLVLGTKWKSRPFTKMNIAAVDVYGGNGGGVSFIDDMGLVRSAPKTYYRGYKDTFASPLEPASKRTQLTAVTGTTLIFDQILSDYYFATSFTKLPKGGCKNFKGTLEMGMKPLGGPSASATISLGLLPTNTFLYNSPLAGVTAPIATPPTSTWTTEPYTLFNWNLLTTPTTGPNLLDHINQFGYLDIFAGNFTQVDFAKLKLWNCCPKWKGFQWDVFGDAVMEVGPTGGLLVSSEIEGGAMLDLGSSDGWAVEYEDGPAISTSGSQWTETARGALNGLDDQWLAEMSFAGAAPNSNVIYDISPLCSQARIKFLRANGTVGYEATGEPTGNFQIRPQTHPPVIKSSSFSAGGLKSPRYCYTLVDPCAIFVNGMLVNDIKTICVEGPSAPNFDGGPPFLSGSVQAANFYMLGLESVTWYQPGFGLPGGVVVVSTGGSGTSGGDNIIVNCEAVNESGTGEPFPCGKMAVDTGEADGFRANLLFDGAAELSNGAKLAIEAFGKKNGVEDSVLGRASIKKVGGQYAFEVDYSAISSPTVRIELLKNGVVIGSVSNHSPIVGTAPIAPTGCGAGEKYSMSQPPPYFCWNWREPINFFVAGYRSYNIDQIRILSQPMGFLNVEHYSCFRFEAMEAEEFGISEYRGLRRVSGNVILQDLQPSEEGQQVVVEVRSPGQSTPLETHVVTLGAFGSLQFSTSVLGNIDVAVKGSKWLRKVESGEVMPDGLSGLIFTLVNGDCDNDNEVTLVDNGIISASFGKSLGDAGYDARADLDGDEEVTLVDVGILNTNFGMAGDD